MKYINTYMYTNIPFKQTYQNYISLATRRIRVIVKVMQILEETRKRHFFKSSKSSMSVWLQFCPNNWYNPRQNIENP